MGKWRLPCRKRRRLRRENGCERGGHEERRCLWKRTWRGSNARRRKTKKRDLMNLTSQKSILLRKPPFAVSSRLGLSSDDWLCLFPEEFETSNSFHWDGNDGDAHSSKFTRGWTTRSLFFPYKLMSKKCKMGGERQLFLFYITLICYFIQIEIYIYLMC